MESRQILYSVTITTTNFTTWNERLGFKMVDSMIKFLNFKRDISRLKFKIKFVDSSVLD